MILAIVADDGPAVAAMLGAAPALATARVEEGATRAQARDHYFSEIEHYVYGGDTALHVAAAAYREPVVRVLIECGADIAAQNRRGAQPLHYAADGAPGSRNWNPAAQQETVATLLAAGADPNVTDKSGVAPLHRAVRTRCSAAVAALLAGGADPLLPNKSGSTPLELARRTTGRGGSGSPEAKAEQEAIVRLLA
ncbi:MAG TPA: ankyrin repeat domain-containing protein [Acidimicrobiia bacterium]